MFSSLFCQTILLESGLIACCRITGSNSRAQTTNDEIPMKLDESYKTHRERERPSDSSFMCAVLVDDDV